MSFNAVVWDAEAKKSSTLGPCFSKSQFTPNLFVVGRVFLSNLTQVPATWRVQHGKRVLSRDSKLGDILWSDTQPLHIFKPRARAIVENEGHITLKHPSGETLQVAVCPATTVAELKVWMFREREIWPRPLRLEFRGKVLTDGERVLDRLSFGSVVDITSKRKFSILPQFASATVDFEGEQLAERHQTNASRGARPGQLINSWKTFHVDNMGLTMYGHCPVPTCDSNVHENCADRVVVQAKYGMVRMASGMDQFKCPLCHTSKPKADSFGMFTPANYNVMFGRALFRFKKCGVNEPVKAVLMESLSATGEYTTFDSSSEPCNYEVIEILTVGPNSSPFYCVKCDIPCGSPGESRGHRWTSEVILSCGHAYHSGCLPKNKACIVCASKIIENLSVLVTDNDYSMTSQTFENDGTGNDVFLDFFSSEGHSDSIVQTACLKIAIHEYQRICREFGITHREEQMAVDEEE